MKPTAYEQVYKLTQAVPRGKVTTYGTIAKKLSVSPRYVGRILHENPDEGTTPCHRVVTSNGRIAPGFAFGGLGEQRKRLEREGVTFKDDTHVNLSQHLHLF